MIAFLCSSCGAQLRVRDELAGATGKCPRCGHLVEAPRKSGTQLPGPTPRPLDTAPTPRAGGDKSPSRAVFDSPANVQQEDLACLAPPEAPDELGRLGPYRILKVLGAGGMGVVFQAEDVLLKRQVALKAMRASVAASPEHRVRFEREAQAAAALEHDHIVTIYQVGEDRGIPYLAMKLLLGESLEDRLNREAPLPADEVLRISQEVAEGLAEAHERGLVHRDVKPANVWLEEGRDRVKIVDFGLARAGDDDTKITQPGYMVGTPAYMAPEQAEAEADVDARADLFSLGCVMYRMATGRLPFQGKNTMAVLMALATKTPTPPRELNPALPPALDRLITRLLEKKPADRPPTARAVVAALTELREAPPPAAEEAAPEVAVEVLEEVEQPPPVKPPAKRSGARKRGGRGRPRGKAAEGSTERLVLRLALVVGIAILLLIAFLIGRRLWKRADAEPTSQVVTEPLAPAPGERGWGEGAFG